MEPKDQTLLSIEDLMNTSVDTVEAAPDFLTPPAGDYVLTVNSAKVEKYRTKKMADTDPDKTRIKIIYAIQEVKQLADANELIPPTGSLFSETFQGSQEGLKYWKKRAIDILGVCTGSSVKEINDELEAGGYSFVARVTLKKSTDKDTKEEYENINIRILKGAQQAELPA